LQSRSTWRYFPAVRILCACGVRKMGMRDGTRTKWVLHPSPDNNAEEEKEEEDEDEEDDVVGFKTPR
jgi:hypothetical protein